MDKIINKFKKIKYANQKKGVALVIAITVMTLLLSISFSISNIVLRQIKTTYIINASKPAFFTADSAIECAMYHDTKSVIPDANTGIDTNKDFGTSIFGSTISNQYATDQIRCGDLGIGTDKGKPLGLNKTINTDQTKVTTTFDVVYGDKCAKVEVVRTELQTLITARGYNTGAKQDNTGCDLTNLDARRLVERGLTITY